MTIRPCASADSPVLHEICLATGSETGGDATASYDDPELLGEVYLGPYLSAPSGLGFVCADETGVAGYVVGVADTAAFEGWCEREWWPRLRSRHPLTSADTPQGRLIRHVHHPGTAAPDLVAEYPAHFHIDLLPRLQGRGLGTRLLTTMLDAFAAAGVPGVHLGASVANTRAIAFYRRLGFVDHARIGAALLLVRRL